MTIRTSYASASAALAARTALLNGGSIKLYTGTRPATPETALSGNTLLASLPFSATAFGAPTNSAGDALATANAITSANASATGTATFFRCFASDGTTAVIDGDCGTSGSDLNLVTTAIVSGQPVQITSMTLKEPVVGK